MAPVASPADVSARVPHLCARLHLQHVKKGVLEGFSQADAFGRLVLQHALDEVEKAVVVLSLRGQVALGREEGEVRVRMLLPVLLTARCVGLSAKLGERRSAQTFLILSCTSRPPEKHGPVALQTPPPSFLPRHFLTSPCPPPHPTSR